MDCVWYLIEVNWAELHYPTQPVDRGGTYFGKKQPCFSTPVQLNEKY